MALLLSLAIVVTIQFLPFKTPYLLCHACPSNLVITFNQHISVQVSNMIFSQHPCIPICFLWLLTASSAFKHRHWLQCLKRVNGSIMYLSSPISLLRVYLAVWGSFVVNFCNQLLMKTKFTCWLCFLLVVFPVRNFSFYDIRWIIHTFFVLTISWRHLWSN